MKTELIPTGDRLVNRAEVARIVGLERSTIYRHMKSGAFPLPLQIARGTVRWRLSEIEAWIDSRPRGTGVTVDRAAA